MQMLARRVAVQMAPEIVPKNQEGMLSEVRFACQFHIFFKCLRQWKRSQSSFRRPHS